MRKTKRFLAFILAAILFSGNAVTAYASSGGTIAVSSTQDVLENKTENAKETVVPVETKTSETTEGTESEEGAGEETTQTESVTETESEESASPESSESEPEEITTEVTTTEVVMTEGITTTEETTTTEGITTTEETTTTEEATVAEEVRILKSVTPVSMDNDIKEEVLQRIRLGIETYQAEVYLGDLAIDYAEAAEVESIYFDLVGYQPQYFWLALNCSVSADTTGVIVEKITIYNESEFNVDGSWKLDPQKVDKARAQLMAEVAAIMEGIPENASDVEKAFHVYHYLLNNVTYDSDWVESNSYNSSYTAYGALVERKAVCQGYMLAYTLLMNYLDIEVKNVVSWTNRHGWNAIYLDGGWYYVDCTWGEFLRTETQLRSAQAATSPWTSNDTWYLYEGREFETQEVENTTLPEESDTSVYSNYLFQYSGGIYVDGYWVYKDSYNHIAYTSLDGGESNSFKDEVEVSLVSQSFAHKVYYTVQDSSSFTTKIKYLDTRTLQVYDTGVTADYGMQNYITYEDGEILADGRTVYTIPTTTIGLMVETPADCEYEVGDEWNPTGMQVYGVSELETAKRLSASEYSVSGFSSDSIGTKTITVTDNTSGETESFTIEVVEAGDTGLHSKRDSYVLTSIGDTVQLQVEVRDDADAVILYESSDENVVQVSESGKITATGNGYAIVWLQTDYETKAVYVAVYTPANIESGGSSGGEGDTPSEGFTYTYTYNSSNQTATITGVSGSGTEMIIPSTTMLGDVEYTVTEVDFELWSYNEEDETRDIIQNQITTLVLPETVSSVGSFSGPGYGENPCSKLKQVTLPTNCQLGISAFSYTAIEKIVLGEGITLKEEDGYSSAFSGCTELKEITLNVDTIPGNCFQGCTSLQTVSWGSNLKTIAANAFYGCTSLSEIVLPEGVESIGNYAFGDCNLTSLTIPSTVKTLGSSIVYAYDREDTCTLHLYCMDIETVEYQNNSQIYYVFHGEFTEEQIAIFKAFGDPFNYEVVDGSDPGPAEKDEDATIFTESQVFLKPGEYYQLKSNYYDIQSLVLENNGKAYYSVDENGLICAKAVGDSAILAYDTEGNYLEGVVVIVYDFAFEQESIQMQLGETRTLVIEGRPDVFEGSYAFSRMEQSIDGAGAVEVVSVTETEPIESGDNVLGVYGLVTVKAVNIGNSTLTLTTQQNRIKASCQIEVIAENNRFSDGSFYYEELKDGTLEITGVVEDEQGLWFNPSPYHVTTEKDGTSYTTVTIPAKVILQGKEYRVSRIAANALNNKTKTVDNGTDYVDSVTHWAGRDNVTLVLEEGIESIGNYAFAYFHTDMVILPSSLKEIGTGAFSGNLFLNEIDIPESVIKLGDGAFANSGVEKAYVRSKIENLPDGLFYGCESLVSVMLPDTLKVLGDSAFENCTSLISVQIPDSVEEIQRHVFGQNTSLKAIGLPRNLITLSNQTFEGCSALRDVYLMCPDFQSKGSYQYLFPDIHENLIFYVSEQYDNKAMLEALYITEYEVLDSEVELTLSGKNSMGIGEVQDLEIEIITDNTFLQENIKWTSSNTEVATVFAGRIMAKAIGETVISAQAFDGSSATFTISVFADNMEEKIEADYPEGICIITNVTKSLSDVVLKENWYWEDENQKITASDKVQNINAYYLENGIKRMCQLPVYVAEIESVTISGRESLLKGSSGVYRVVLQGTGVNDTMLEAAWISWDTTELSPNTTTEDGESGNIKISANVTGEYAISATVAITDTIVMSATKNIRIVEEVSTEAFGDLDNADFSVKNGDYTIAYRILESGTEVEVVGIAGYKTECEIPESVTYAENTYTVTALNMTDVRSATNAGAEVDTLTLPGTITGIQPGSFKNFIVLDKIQIAGTSVLLKVGADGALYNQDETYLFWIPWKQGVTYTVPATVEDMDSYEMVENRGEIEFASGCKLQIKSKTDKDAAPGYGGIYSSDGKKMLAAPFQTNGVVHIPYGVEEIAPYAFYGMWAPEIYVPDTVSLIDSYAFYQTENNESTQKIYFAENSCLTQLNAYAFYDTEITHIHLPKSVDRIGKGAFYSTTLQEFSVGGALSYVGESQFFDEDLPQRYELLQNPQVKLIERDDIYYLINTEEKNASVAAVMKTEPGTLVIPSFVENEEVTYPVVKLEAYLGNLRDDFSEFYSRSYVTAVQIPASVKEIADCAFGGFTTLKRVEFAQGSALVTMGECSFIGCTSLDILVLPESLENLTDSTYTDDGADGRKIITSSGVSGLESIGTDILTIGTDVYEEDGLYWTMNGAEAELIYAADSSEIIPDSFTLNGIEYPLSTLGDGAFAGTTRLDVKLPNSITSIGTECFANSRLTGITIPAVTTLGSGVFANSVELRYVMFTGKTAPTVESGEQVTFRNGYDLSVLIVPQIALNGYQTAFADEFTNCSPEYQTFTDYVSMTDFAVEDEGGNVIDSLNLKVGESVALSIVPTPSETTDSTNAVWSVDAENVVRTRDDTVWAIAAGEAVLKVTVAGITKEIPVVVSDVEKQQADIASPVLSATLDAKNRVLLTWDALEGADGLALYRSKNPDDGFVRMKVKLSGTRTLHLDTTIAHHTTYYYKLIGYKQNADGSFAFGEESNIVSIRTKYTGNPVAITGIYLNKGFVELEAGEGFGIEASLLPANHTEDVTIQYTSTNPEVVDYDQEKEQWIAKKAGRTSIIATIVYADGSVSDKKAKCDVVVTQTVDLTSFMAAEDVYVAITSKNTLKDVAMPEAILKELELYGATAVWKEPETELRKHIGSSFEAEINVTAQEEELYQFKTGTVSIYVSEITGLTVNSDVSELYLDEKNQATISTMVSVNGTIKDDTLSYEMSIKETSRLGLVIAENETDNTASVTVNAKTKTGNGKVKVVVNAVDKNTGDIVYKVTKTLSYTVKPCEQGIRVLSISRSHEEVITTGENVLEELEPGDLLTVEAQSYGISNPAINFTIANKKLVALQEVSVSQSGEGTDEDVYTAIFRVADKADGITKITIASKTDKKVQENLVVAIKDYTPTIATKSISLDKNKDSGSELMIHPSYGMLPSEITLSSVLYKGKDVSDLFTITENEKCIYTINIAAALTPEQISAMETGTYKAVITANVKEAQKEIGTIAIKVTATNPSVTIKQTKAVNFFYADYEEGNIKTLGDSGKGKLTISSKNAEIKDIVWSEDSDFAVDEEGTIYLQATENKNISALNKKIKATVTFEGYRDSYTVDKTITLKTTTAKPKIQVETENSKWYTYLLQEETKLTVTDRSVKEVIKPSAMTTLQTNSDRYEIVISEDGEFLLRLKEGKTARTENVKWTLSVDNWKSPISGKIRIVVDNRMPAIKLSSAKLTLNTYTWDEKELWKYEQAVAAVSVDRLKNMEIDHIQITPRNSAANIAGDKISLVYEDGTLKASFNEKVDKGTYTYTLQPLVSVNGTDIVLKESSITISVIQSKPGVKVKAKGSIDVLQRTETAITYTPTVSGLSGELKEAEVIGRDADFFLCKVNENGSVSVLAKEDAVLRTDCKYQIQLLLKLKTERGECSITTQNLSFKVKQGRVVIKATQPKEPYPVKAAFMSGGYGLETKLTMVRPTNAEIERISLVDTTGRFELDDWEQTDTGEIVVTVSMKGTEEKQNFVSTWKKSYRLKLEMELKGAAQNAKPINSYVTVKVVQ